MANVQPQRENDARAIEAFFDKEKRVIVVRLQGGTVLSLPVHKIQDLASASDKDIAAVELMPQGAALHWENLDLDFSISGLAAGVFGTRAWMTELGRKGGLARSDEKTAAARENGRKGGRPPKPRDQQSSFVLHLGGVPTGPQTELLDPFVSGQSQQSTKDIIKYKEGLIRLEPLVGLRGKSLTGYLLEGSGRLIQARIEGAEETQDYATLAPAA